MVTVGFHTLGCKVNQQETGALTAQFVDAGFCPVDFNLEADVYVINSCAVTVEAERKSKSLARRKKKNHPEALVVLAGCFPQVALREADVLGVDVLVGSNDKKELVGMVQEALADRRQIIKVTPFGDDTPFEIIADSTSSERTRGMLKVQDGCEQFCAYCIIPYARGRERSLDIKSALIQAKNSIAQGMSEIVLTGIHLGSYGQDLTPPATLAQLVREMAELPGLLRLRLGSLEPLDMTAELIKAVSFSPQVCRHFHLPLQSGSNAVLRRMKRPYSKEGFSAVVARLRDAFPEAGITSDVIVGFPGETEEQFAESLSFIRTMEFGRLHVFRYSRRPGTEAANMVDQVPERVKDERYRAMQQVAVLAQQAFAERFVDREVSVLVEEEHEGFLTGYSSSYLRVYFPGDRALIGKLVNVAISMPFNDGARGDLQN